MLSTQETVVPVSILHFLQHKAPPTPCLVMDLGMVSQKYWELRQAFPNADIHYAVKANPDLGVLQTLAYHGSHFDIASVQELDHCLALGVSPERISFGNTIKKSSAVAYAYQHGVRLFAFDSSAELYKIAVHAPGSKVMVRVLVENQGAEWPLSRKFGCDPEMALELVDSAVKLGLQPVGIAFHVGSQQLRLDAWDKALKLVASMFRRSRVALELLNVGGGFPAHYHSRRSIPKLSEYAEGIQVSLQKYFGRYVPKVMLEPGRALVADAGVIQTEVVLISHKSNHDKVRWVFIDVGRFGGLAETEGESIRYLLHSEREGPSAPVILAGPTCDSADVLYEKYKPELPLELQIGDRLEILSAGAYTSTYSSIGFNGFSPLKTYCLEKGAVWA